MALVYKVTNNLNGKVYIGYTTRTLKQRWAEHSAPSRVTTVLHKAIKKYGKENFSIEEVFVSSCIKTILDKEKELISQYNSFNSGGYNATFGGEASIPTKATCAKISAAKKGHAVSEETRDKLRKVFNRIYIIATPRGLEKVSNLKQFCDKQQLSYTYMLKTLKNSTWTHKGYAVAGRL
jgi:group I intron endonuclease